MPPQTIDQTAETADDAASGGLGTRPKAATPNVFGLLRRLCDAFRRRVARRRRPVGLDRLSERQLRDIGIASGEIECMAARRALDSLKDRSSYMFRSGL